MASNVAGNIKIFGRTRTFYQRQDGQGSSIAKPNSIKQPFGKEKTNATEKPSGKEKTNATEKMGWILAGRHYVKLRMLAEYKKQNCGRPLPHRRILDNLTASEIHLENSDDGCLWTIGFSLHRDLLPGLASPFCGAINQPRAPFPFDYSTRG
ncbi:uncharacterized protein LOC143825676 isoform X2 [Paroedura picta]|uniref:uncharacterized protein LOC143825676 isoform X2 n=1 Tax=Paroedura picta TaxID=143630 RepID=UPI0040579DB1